MTNQQLAEKPELVFWFDAPPRAGAGAFRYVAQEWGNTVHYLCARPLREERRAGGWEDCDHGKARITILSEQPDPHGFVRGFVQAHPDAIYVCNGFRSLTSPYIKKWLFSTPEARIAVWSERPGVYGNQIKRMLRALGLPLLHRYYAFRYGNRIRVLLPLGTLGVNSFVNFGWDRRVCFPFMYDPPSPSILSYARSRASGKPLRLLYVGRFANSTKGVDVLIGAINGLCGANWHLDLVGGYGDHKNFVIAWAEKHANVSFLGTWPSQDVCKRIAHYDVCIIPSRFDGWNVVTNEAIRAGIGVIVTDAAVSDDLVRASGAGVVVPAGDVLALRKAIQQVVDDPAIADLWKQRARAYSPRISSESVGRYLMEVLDYTFLNRTRPRPVCPWL